MVRRGAGEEAAGAGGGGGGADPPKFISNIHAYLIGRVQRLDTAV